MSEKNINDIYIAYTVSSATAIGDCGMCAPLSTRTRSVCITSDRGDERQQPVELKQVPGFRR